MLQLGMVKYRNMEAKKSTHSILHLVISALLTVLLIFIVFSESSLSELHRIARDLSTPFLIAFITCSITALFLRALRYRLMLAAMRIESLPSFWRILLITGVRNAFVDFLPARLGELSYIYFLNCFGVRVASGISSFGLCIVLDLLSLILVAALFALCSIAFEFGSGPTLHFNSTNLFVAFLVLSAIFGFGLYVLVHLHGIFSYMSEIVGKMSFLKRAEPILRMISLDLDRVKNYRVLAWLLLVTIALRVAKYSGLYFLALSILGAWNISWQALSPLGSFAVFVVSEASASLPISGLMGFGVYEGVWSTLFSYACGNICDGLPATTIAFSVHLITQIIGYGIGILCLFLIFVILFFSKRILSEKSKIIFALLFLVPANNYALPDALPYFKVSNSLKLPGKLAFSASFEGHSRVYVLDFKENAIQELGPKGVDLSYPSFSPDGRLLAVSIGPEAKRNIAVMTREGKDLRILGQSDLNSDNPAFSPDSSSVVFYREQKNNPKISNLFLGYPDRTGEVRQLTNLRGRNTTPQWSSDGRSIAFSTDRFWPGWDLCIYNLDTKKESCPLGGVETYCRPRFSNDGKRLAYSYGAFESVDIYLRVLKTNEDVRITELLGREYDATWSPDDRFVAFTNNGDSKKQFKLFVVDTADRKVHALVETNASIRFLSWAK